MLEEDRNNAMTQVRLKDEAIVITPASSGIIDLKSLVSGGAPVSMSVTGQPRHGELESLGNDLLQYTPFPSFTEGRDSFTVSIFGENNSLISQDSVIIIVTIDSLAVPSCGVYARNDYYENVNGPVDFHVLVNDTVCGVTRDKLVVSIPDIEIEGVLMPKSSYGNLQVLSDGRIRYTPGPSYEGTDKFVYQVTKPANIPNAGDPELTSHAFVYIFKADPPVSCRDSLRLLDDDFRFVVDSTQQLDTVRLDVIANDNLCPDAMSEYVFSIQQFPEFGEVRYDYSYGYLYTFPAQVSTGFVDRFRYKICLYDRCRDAEVIIRTD